MEFGGDDLSCDAVPTMDPTPEVLRGNQPDHDTYSFISRLWSQRERDDYLNKIEIIKKWYKLENFGDVLMLCSKVDTEEASDYCEYLRTLQMRGGPGQTSIRVKASLMEDEVLPGQSVFSGPENSLSRFTFAFLYVTKTSHKDCRYLHFQDMCLQKKMKNKEEGCLAVVYSDDVNPDRDIASKLQGELIICASDRSEDTERSKDKEKALIKKLESKLYLRGAKEKKFIEETFKKLTDSATSFHR